MTNPNSFPAPAGAKPKAKAAAPSGSKKQISASPRRVRLTLSRVQPLSVMRVAFLLSVAAGIMLVVAAAVVWFALDALHVFSKIQELANTVMDSDSNTFTALVEYMKFSRAIAMATIIAVINVVLTTVLATIGSLLYNVTTTLVGGVHLTLADD